MAKIAIVITAAGSSTRIGGNIKKEYLSYKNGTVLSNCALAFLNADYKNNDISIFVITCPKGGIEDCKKALYSDTSLKSLFTSKGLTPYIVEGGNSRQASVFNALKCIKENANDSDAVLIHDGARPFVSSKVIEDTLDATLKYQAAVPGVIPIDTQKEVDDNGFIIRHLVRSSLRAVQTPQGFNFPLLYKAHIGALEIEREYTDDTEVWGEILHKEVKLVDGDVNNIKITYPSDLEKL